MMEGLVGHKNSTFGSTKWREGPWRGVEKDPQQKLYDCGFRLTGLIERTDSIMADVPAPVKDVNNLIRNFDDLFQTLSRLHRGCLCSQVQFPIGLIGSATLSKVHVRQSNLGIRDQFGTNLIRCILLIGFQLSSCIMMDMLRRSNQFRDGQIVIDDGVEHTAVQNQRVRNSLSLTILRLTTAVVGNDFDPAAILRIMWALQLAHSQLDRAYSVQCKELLKLYSKMELPLVAEKFHVHYIKGAMARYCGVQSFDDI